MEPYNFSGTVLSAEEETRLQEGVTQAFPDVPLRLVVSCGGLDGRVVQRREELVVEVSVPGDPGPCCLPRHGIGLLKFPSTLSLAAFIALHEVAHLFHASFFERGCATEEARCDRMALLLQEDLGLNPPELEAVRRN